MCLIQRKSRILQRLHSSPLVWCIVFDVFGKHRIPHTSAIYSLSHSLRSSGCVVGARMYHRPSLLSSAVNLSAVMQVSIRSPYIDSCQAASPSRLAPKNVFLDRPIY